MLTEFGKVLIFFIIGAAFVAAGLVTAWLLRPHRPYPQKLSTYECGEEPVGNAWVKFNVRFYVIALIFLIFDVEVVLLFPWALTYKEYGIYGFAVGLIFLLVLGLGMVYEWRKGDLEWARPQPNTPKLDEILNSKS